MALYSKKEFSDLCGVATKNLSNYISRGNVVVDGEKIDDTDPKNKMFRDRMVARGLLKGNPDAEKPAKKEKKGPTPDQEERKDVLSMIMKEKGELEVMQRRNLIALQQIDIQKKRGELVPTQSVLALMVQHSENIKTAYTEGSDSLIVIISQQRQLSATEVAHLRTEFLKIVNKAVDNAIDASKQNLKNLVKEFSVKRGVGEHD